MLLASVVVGSYGGQDIARYGAAYYMIWFLVGVVHGALFPLMLAGYDLE